ncbi:VOC family protein [Shouchella clausii]|uniref:VOC family protein n=1 Tax=Shouchella clausii TaxID=79880 RepID=UPI00214996FD|nr:VOC family protein [Shouchella clausii]MCR1288228.1 VOC family protein [Shouchella clausii]
MNRGVKELALAFDHVIHYVDDAHTLKDRFINKGFHTIYGGRHEQRGSYNTLLHFGMEYIEFLSIDDRSLFDKVGAQDVAYSPFSSIVRDEFTEGFAKICLRTRDLNKLAQTFKQKGLNVNGPVPLSRKRPDGKLLEWSLLFVGEEGSELPLPFFIDWHETDQERLNELKEAQVVAPHSAGQWKIDSFLMAVHDAKQTAFKWAEWFDLEHKGSVYDPRLNADIYTLQLPGGNLKFAQPKGQGPVNEFLEQRGERPFQLMLTGSGQTELFTIHGGHYVFNGGETHA